MGGVGIKLDIALAISNRASPVASVERTISVEEAHGPGQLKVKLEACEVEIVDLDLTDTDELLQQLY